MLEPKKNGLLAVAALILPLALAGCAGNAIRVATHADLKVFDPVWTTAYITRNHGYLVYDTLFALDENFEPKPQMVNKWEVSKDQKTWIFTLRDGLKWHDGGDVTAEDCVASLERWGKRDGVGQQLFRDIESLTATDNKTITMKLRAPSGLVLDALAKVSSNVPFMMPKRLAQTDPSRQIQEYTGSGPYIFQKGESVPGSKVVYVKNPNYVARAEPMSMAAGGKVAKPDRIEWRYYTDPAQAVKALIDHDVDYVESPSARLVPLLEDKKYITVASTDPLGNMAMVRFNTLQPPFNKAEIRRAALMAMPQADYMTAALGDQKFWRLCYSVYPCGTPLANNSGSDIMKATNLDAAKKALQSAGYDGTPVVILNPVDSPVISAFTKVTVENLQKIGMKVQVQDMTWGAVTERRANRAPVAEGGWNLFHTWWLAADVMDPLAIVFSGDRDNGWYGWPKDDELEKYRAAYAQAKNQDEKKHIAGQVQGRLVAIGALGILGQFFEPVAYNSKLQGITSPIQFYWNLSY